MIGLKNGVVEVSKSLSLSLNYSVVRTTVVVISVVSCVGIEV